MEVLNNIAGLVNQLDDNLDDLEESLNPLLESAPSEIASKLPLLDRAKFYILTTYAIESALFAFLKLKGSDAKEHPVFRELVRVKQYFEKIKVAEGGAQQPNLRVDQAAVGRIVNHALARKHHKFTSQAEPMVEVKSSTTQSNERAAPSKRKFNEVEAVEPNLADSKDIQTNSQEQHSDSSSASSSDLEAAEVPVSESAKTTKKEPLAENNAVERVQAVASKSESSRKKGKRAANKTKQGYQGGDANNAGLLLHKKERRKPRKPKLQRKGT